MLKSLNLGIIPIKTIKIKHKKYFINNYCFDYGLHYLNIIKLFPSINQLRRLVLQ